MNLAASIFFIVIIGAVWFLIIAKLIESKRRMEENRRRMEKEFQEFYSQIFKMYEERDRQRRTPKRLDDKLREKLFAIYKHVKRNSGHEQNVAKNLKG